MKYHIGRSWSGTKLEDDCPCEKAPCGLAVSTNNNCPQHSPFAVKTIRQMHTEDDCPGEKMIDPKLQFLTEPDVEAENQKLHSEWMIEHIRANAAEERVRQLEDFILGANFSSIPEPPFEVESDVYIWRGRYNVYTEPDKSVLLPWHLPRDLKAEEAIELGKFLYAAGQVSKGIK